MIPIGKIGQPLRSLLFQVKTAMVRWERLIFQGYPVFTVWNAARVLALATLLSVGTAMYFDMASGGAADVAPAAQDIPAATTHASANYLRQFYSDDEWLYGPPYVETHSASGEPSSPVRPIAEYIPEDELWVPPYYEFFLESQEAGLVPHLRISPYDEWGYGSPYLGDFSSGVTPGPSAIGHRRYIPDDELWVSPYYEVFDNFMADEGASPGEYPDAGQGMGAEPDHPELAPFWNPHKQCYYTYDDRPFGQSAC